MTARSFDVYRGFGAPLEVLDDRDLLHKMALLKQSAQKVGYLPQPPQRPPPPRADRPGSAGNSSKRSGEQHGIAGAGAPISSQSPQRPHTAPPVRRPQQSRAIPPSAPSLPGGRHQQQRDLNPQQAARARRESWLREQNKQTKRDVARLEERWVAADAVVSERRGQMAAAARGRVAAWDGKRRSGANRIAQDNTRRMDLLRADLDGKNQRVEEWRQRTEASERQRREEHAAMRLEASKRFSSGLRNRETHLREAEERVAARVGAMAELKRAELTERVERGMLKQFEAMQMRQRVEDAQHAREAATERELKRKAAKVDAFLQKKRETHATKVATRKQGVGADASHADGPQRRPQTSPRQPTSARPTSARGQRPAYPTGMETVPLKCALCEAHFSQLTGVTFLNQVASKRAEFGDDQLLGWCKNRGYQVMYGSASLCVFCCQFFQQGWSTTAGSDA
jgi:hypothetical protein